VLLVGEDAPEIVTGGGRNPQFEILNPSWLIPFDP
jgi:hypothetical protein